MLSAMGKINRLAEGLKSCLKGEIGVEFDFQTGGDHFRCTGPHHGPTLSVESSSPSTLVTNIAFSRQEKLAYHGNPLLGGGGEDEGRVESYGSSAHLIPTFCTLIGRHF